jgi:2-polyprenyl-6-methoxyphenol hydroxylase-like FAD-dependent oxidoreductase
LSPLGPQEVTIVGGGPGGLFLARLLRRHDPGTRVVVHERNAPDATFGFGVVFSARTLDGLRRADAEIHDRIVEASERWTDMELRLPDGVVRYGGFGFTAIARTTLLGILQDGAAATGAVLRFEDEVTLADVAESQIVVASDGVNSGIRDSLGGALGTSGQDGTAKYAWFATTSRFDAVTFPFVETQHGPFAAHAYPYDAQHSTFIVEVDERTWRRAGMDEWTAAAHAPGDSDLRSSAYLEQAFAEHLDGRPLLVNNSKWSNFRVIRNARWHHRNVVLVGDAAHTAHFSVGSGTKMAMEDAVSLAQALARHHRLDDAYAAYEGERRPAVARTQAWAATSQRWWETFGRRRFPSPEQFGFHFITRTGAMTYRGLRRRDAGTVEAAEQHYFAPTAGSVRRSAMAAALEVRGKLAGNRLVLAVGDLNLDGPPGSDVLAALRRSGAGMVIVPAAAVADDALEPDGALVCAQVQGSDLEAIAHAARAGADLVEVSMAAPADREVPSLVAAAGRVPLAIAWTVPLEDPWQPRAAERVRLADELVHAGGLGVRLIPDLASPDHERPFRPHPALPGLALADRIRTETGALVTLTAAPGWSLSAPLSSSGDDWSAQAHMALVAGRIDLLATWPLPLAAHEFRVSEDDDDRHQAGRHDRAELEYDDGDGAAGAVAGLRVD